MEPGYRFNRFNVLAHSWIAQMTHAVVAHYGLTAQVSLMEQLGTLVDPHSYALTRAAWRGAMVALLALQKPGQELVLDSYAPTMAKFRTDALFRQWVQT